MSDLHITETEATETLRAEYAAGVAEGIRQAREAAWDEGYEAAANFHEGAQGRWVNDRPRRGVRSWVEVPAPTNPYRPNGAVDE